MVYVLVNALPPKSSKATVRGMAKNNAKPRLTIRDTIRRCCHRWI